MKRIFAAIIAATVGTATFWSCADDAPDRGSELINASFDAWMAKNAPKAVKYKDIYIDYIERGPAQAVQPALGQSWVTLDYTGRLLDGSVFVTRSEDVSKLVGKYSTFTHYTPDFVHYTNSSAKFCAGLVTALQDMRVGDSAHIYIPASQGFNSTGMNMNGGYAGESGTTYSMYPVVFEMRLKGSTLDPDAAEKRFIKQYADAYWGAGKYYNDTLDMVLSRKIKLNPAGDTITPDSAIWVYYEAFFMDGFLAKTNWDSVAIAHGQFDAELGGEGYYGPITVNPNILGTSEFNNKVLYLVLPRMRKGEVLEALSVSHWAFGQAGRSGDEPEILPYQPLRYLIYALEKNPTDEEELD